MKNVMILLAVVAVLALAVPAYGGKVTFWNDTTGDHLFHTPENWSNGLPSNGVWNDTAYNMQDGSAYPCKIVDGDSYDTFHINANDYGSSSPLFEMEGGTVACRISLGYRYNGNWAKWKQTGGALNGTVYAGGINSKGRLTLAGGTFNGAIYLGKSYGYSGGTGELIVDGMKSSNITLSFLDVLNDKARIEFTLYDAGGARTVTVTGNANLNGTLAVTEPAGGYAGPYTLMTFASYTGNFSDKDLPANWDYVLNQGDGNPGSGSLVVIPEPATLALLGLGGIGVLRRRKRR